MLKCRCFARRRWDSEKERRQVHTAYSTTSDRRPRAGQSGCGTNARRAATASAHPQDHPQAAWEVTRALNRHYRAPNMLDSCRLPLGKHLAKLRLDRYLDDTSQGCLCLSCTRPHSASPICQIASIAATWGLCHRLLASCSLAHCRTSRKLNPHREPHRWPLGLTGQDRAGGRLTLCTARKP
jgi:hypothetical protein